MHGDDWQLRGDGVEILGRGVTLLLELRVVVPNRHDAEIGRLSSRSSSALLLPPAMELTRPSGGGRRSPPPPAADGPHVAVGVDGRDERLARDRPSGRLAQCAVSIAARVPTATIFPPGGDRLALGFLSSTVTIGPRSRWRRVGCGAGGGGDRARHVAASMSGRIFTVIAHSPRFSQPKRSTSTGGPSPRIVLPMTKPSPGPVAPEADEIAEARMAGRRSPGDLRPVSAARAGRSEEAAQEGVYHHRRQDAEPRENAFEREAKEQRGQAQDHAERDGGGPGGERALKPNTHGEGECCGRQQRARGHDQLARDEPAPHRRHFGRREQAEEQVGEEARGPEREAYRHAERQPQAGLLVGIHALGRGAPRVRRDPAPVKEGAAAPAMTWSESATRRS
jgi:hypothetical protein